MHETVRVRVNTLVDAGIAPIVEALSAFPDIVVMDSCENGLCHPTLLHYPHPPYPYADFCVHPPQPRQPIDTAAFCHRLSCGMGALLPFFRTLKITTGFFGLGGARGHLTIHHTALGSVARAIRAVVDTGLPEPPPFIPVATDERPSRVPAQAIVTTNAYVDTLIAPLVGVLNMIPFVQSIESCQGEAGDPNPSEGAGGWPWVSFYVGCPAAIGPFAAALDAIASAIATNDACRGQPWYLELAWERGEYPPEAHLRLTPGAVAAVTDALSHMVLGQDLRAALSRSLQQDSHTASQFDAIASPPFSNETIGTAAHR